MSNSEVHVNMDLPFNQRVYEVVQQIPQGYVLTYGQVASLIGSPRSARLVGYALHSNPAEGVIPCHRVVFRDGSLAPGFAFGGPNAQLKLLKNEGCTLVHVDADAELAGAPEWKVDLSRCQWKV